MREAYLRLANGESHHWTDRRHLIRAAAKAMRCVLIDHARRRANRQAVEGERTALDRVLVSYESRAINLVRLEKALEELGETEPEMVRAVELRFFAGLRMEDVAEALDKPHRTLERRWALVRAWLLNRLS